MASDIGFRSTSRHSSQYEGVNQGLVSLYLATLLLNGQWLLGITPQRGGHVRGEQQREVYSRKRYEMEMPITGSRISIPSARVTK